LKRRSSLGRGLVVGFALGVESERIQVLLPEFAARRDPVFAMPESGWNQAAVARLAASLTAHQPGAVETKAQPEPFIP